jgi:hypothetical protein
MWEIQTANRFHILHLTPRDSFNVPDCIFPNQNTVHKSSSRSHGTGLNLCGLGSSARAGHAALQKAPWPQPQRVTKL